METKEISPIVPESVVLFAMKAQHSNVLYYDLLAKENPRTLDNVIVIKGRVNADITVATKLQSIS